MTLTVEIERSGSGEWVAEVMELPGCMVVERTEGKALANAEALALRVLADRLEHGEAKPEEMAVSFVTRVAA
ncbi:MAG: type II toxin-antitoxin system HicB family antitoxin [Acidithiobacillales bacterium]